MRCTFHINHEMVARYEKIPRFMTTFSSHKERLVYRCPVERCPSVALDYDALHVDARYCYICGERLLNGEGLANSRHNKRGCRRP